VPDIAIHETEAGYCYRIRCVTAREEHGDKLTQIGLNAQEMRGRIEFCLRIFPFFEILELPIERRSVDAIVGVSGMCMLRVVTVRTRVDGSSLLQ
jgi:hypothetical protein